jgi:prophage antirepressor-like protein
MDNLALAKSENFGNVQCDFWRNDNGQVFMTNAQLAQSLGYASKDAFKSLLSRNKYLKEKEFSQVVSICNPLGGTQETRVFSEDGIYEVAFLSQDSENAMKFRAWVRKILKALRSGELKLQPETKRQEIEARLRNSKARQGRVLLSAAEKFRDILSRQAIELLIGEAAEITTGKMLLAKPQIEKTYTAGEIGNELGISGNAVGRIANANSLKTKQYGIEVLDKSSHSSKQVPTWRYNEAGRARLIEIVSREKVL